MVLKKYKHNRRYTKYRMHKQNLQIDRLTIKNQNYSYFKIDYEFPLLGQKRFSYYLVNSKI